MGKGAATQVEHFRNVMKIRLLSASANAQGDWFNVRGIRPYGITITGDFSGGGTISVYVSNEDAEPGTDVAEYPALDQAYTAPAFLQLDTPVWWICVKYTSHSAGSVAVNFLGG
jgi:hypothetical protein